MLVKRAATLQETLRLKKLPANGTAWHELLLEGLPYSSLRSTAKVLGMKEPELVAHLGLKSAQAAARKRARRLHAPESDVLYAIALAYVRLAGFMEPVKAREWLKSPNEALKGYRPIDLLRTRLGTEYVMTAIERIRPAPILASKVEDPSEGDDPEDE